MKKRMLAAAFTNCEKFNPSNVAIYRPILDGFPDAALLAICNHSKQDGNPISMCEAVIASLAAEKAGDSLFGDEAFLPASPSRGASKRRCSAGDVDTALQYYTENQLATIKLAHYRHYHAVRQPTYDSRLPRNAGESQSAERSRLRTTMLYEVCAGDGGSRELNDVPVPSISSHFRVVDLLMHLSFKGGIPSASMFGG